MTIINIAQDKAIQEAREQVAYVGRMLFDRYLTDSAGGNISVRVGDLVVMSPTRAGQLRNWQIDAEDTLVCDLERNILVGEGGLTREANVHFGLLTTYREYGSAVIHAHPRNLMVFACSNQAMPPIQEGTLKFGTTPTIEYTPAHSPLLGERIVESMRGREARISKHAAGTIAPWHGLFLIGKTLLAAFDAVERLDNNAYVLMMSQQIGASHMLERERADFANALAEYGEDEDY